MIRLSRTLSFYIARQYLMWFLGLMLILTGVIWLFEIVEMLRRAASRDAIGFGVVLKLTLLKLPETVQTLFHFAVLFSAMFTFWRLTRSQELVVARAAGVSVWQFLFPVLVVAAGLGVAKIGVINPIGAAMLTKYEQMEAAYFEGRTSFLEISGGGIWLRQGSEDGSAIIFATQTDPEEVALENAIVFLYGPENEYEGRIDAERMTLRNGYWEMLSARVTMGAEQPRFVPAYRLPTDLTPQSIEDSFATPETLSFWDLPEFIRTLEETGFSSLRHRIYYNALLAQPFLLAAMVLFAAAFSLRQTRRGGALVMVIGGVVTGFTLFLMNDLVLALGLAESIPVLMAAWSPALIALMIGTATLLHLEDG
ncbi:LPS export ABC transporter permease LptG [Inquilinus sp. CAU 1745]|uniref:LPS export ABC transporter permease LptG n=1 Tax=Inquilinus sp. CAU 1745 TaxID=3140369 RepID=UPI00325B542E